MAPEHSVAASDDEYRLPTDLLPKHYDLTIKTHLDTLQYSGIAKIALDVVRDASRIAFHSSGLQLHHVSLHSDALEKEITLTSPSIDDSQHRVEYDLPFTIPAGSKVELRIAFSAEINSSISGYFKSTWKDGETTRNYAITHLQPISARKAFPCWDEPGLKATFALTMVSRADTVNLNNMPVLSEEVVHAGQNVPADLEELFPSAESGQWKITKFETTPPMSTYIVAFANGHFSYIEDFVKMPLSGRTIPLRVYATADVLHQAQYALDVKKAVLPLYEEVFDVEYPLPKLDTIVASDYESGAMENWGLIVGRTSVLLLDPEKADLAGKKRVLTVQSHEVAHMWFGNVVTMEWWDYLYLNEAFATLMGEVIVPDRVYPEWKVNTGFINSHLHQALNLDAKTSSHPIEVACFDANLVSQIFDSLSYSKGASVLRMLSNYVGQENLLKGVSIYLKKHLFGSTTTRDLWEGIAEATGVDIASFMDNWITKIGFPVLTVTESDGGITVRQDRFFETGASDESQNETLWNVPLCIVTEQDGKGVVDKSVVLKDREATFSLDTTKPFKLNAGTFGVYRTLYTPERLASIAATAGQEGSIFSADDRLGLLQDAMALAKAGFGQLSSVLTLIELWHNEQDNLVWETIGEAVDTLVSTWWENPEIVEKLDAFRRKLFGPLVNKYGYEFSTEEPTKITQLRTLAIDQAANAGDEGVVDELRKRFAEFLKTDNDAVVHPNLLRVTYRIAVRYGGREEYDAMVGFHGTSISPGQRSAAMRAMGATQDDDLILNTLNFILDKVQTGDLFPFFLGLGSNFKARRTLTKYFNDHFATFFERLEGSFALPYLIPLSMQYYSTEEDAKAAENFYQDKDTSKFALSLAQGIETVRARAKYVERSTEDLQEWLSERY